MKPTESDRRNGRCPLSMKRSGSRRLPVLLVATVVFLVAQAASSAPVRGDGKNHVWRIAAGVAVDEIRSMKKYFAAQRAGAPTRAKAYGYVSSLGEEATRSALTRFSELEKEKSGSANREQHLREAGFRANDSRGAVKGLGLGAGAFAALAGGVALLPAGFFVAGAWFNAIYRGIAGLLVAGTGFPLAQSARAQRTAALVVAAEHHRAQQAAGSAGEGAQRQATEDRKHLEWARSVLSQVGEGLAFNQNALTPRAAWATIKREWGEVRSAGLRRYVTAKRDAYRDERAAARYVIESAGDASLDGLLAQLVVKESTT